jgi:hypothetical protein
VSNVRSEAGRYHEQEEGICEEQNELATCSKDMNVRDLDV